ncbi:hypothetical protein KDL01_29600, partial [Actinospica durhamensis]
QKAAAQLARAVAKAGKRRRGPRRVCVGAGGSQCLDTVAVQVVSVSEQGSGKSTTYLVTVTGIGAGPKQVQLEGSRDFTAFAAGAQVDAELWRGQAVGFEVGGAYVQTTQNVDENAAIAVWASLLLFVVCVEMVGFAPFLASPAAYADGPLTREQLRYRTWHATVQPFLLPMAVAFTIETCAELRLLFWELPLTLGIGLAGLAIGVTALRSSLRRRADRQKAAAQLARAVAKAGKRRRGPRRV